MKKIMLSALLLAMSVMAFGTTTVTVHNTSGSIGVCTGCTYTVRLQSFTFTKPGSINWATSESIFSTHTVSPGSSYTWNINPPAGYSPLWSSLSIDVTWCSTGHTLGNSSTIRDYNPCNCSNTDYQTVWDRNSDGDYNIHCEVVVGKSLEDVPVKSEEQSAASDLEKAETFGNTVVTEKATLVTPNPSSGIFTIRPGTDLPASTYNATIIDASGKVVYTKNNLPANSPLQIDLTALPKGIYLLNIISGDKKSSHRLMKE
jgi:hypothetical protein